MNATNELILQNETLFNNTAQIINKTGIFTMWVIGTITCVMNAIVIFALLKANVLRENTHRVLVLSLSFSDFLSGIGTILYGFDLLMYRYVSWSFFLILYSVFVSLSQIFLLCIEAYLSVCASLVYKEKLLGGNRKYFVIAVIWLINLLYYSMLYFSVSDVNAGFVSPVACISFSIVYVLTVSFYVTTLHKIRQSKRRIDSKQKNIIKIQSQSEPKVFYHSSEKLDIAIERSKFETNATNTDQNRSIMIVKGRSSAIKPSETISAHKNTRYNDNYIEHKAGCSRDEVSESKQEFCHRYCTSRQSYQHNIQFNANNQKHFCADHDICAKSVEKPYTDENKVMNKNANEMVYGLKGVSRGSTSKSYTNKSEIRPQKIGTRRNVSLKSITWHRRSSFTIGLMLLALTVCCLPFILLTMLFSLSVPCIARSAVHYSGMFMLLNGILDPIIYVVRIREFRNLQCMRF